MDIEIVHFGVVAMDLDGVCSRCGHRNSLFWCHLYGRRNFSSEDVHLLCRPYGRRNCSSPHFNIYLNQILIIFDDVIVCLFYPFCRLLAIIAKRTWWIMNGETLKLKIDLNML